MSEPVDTRKAEACEPRVDHEPGTRYPYRPACSCGWQNHWGYVRERAARNIADAHVRGEF